MNVKTKGYMLGVVAAATYGMNPLFALQLYKVGQNPDGALFFRSLFATTLSGIMLKVRGHDLKVCRSEILPLFVLGIMVALPSLTLFECYNYMDAGICLVMRSALSYL